MYIVEVPSCHTRDLRFHSVDGEDSLNNLNRRLEGISVCFRQNILAALVITNWREETWWLGGHCTSLS